MKPRLFSTLFLTLMLSVISASAQTKSVQDVDLWQKNGLPNSNGIDTEPFDDSKRNYKPSIRVFLPEQPDGRAVIACPGGGYSNVAMGHEGYDWAEFFNKQGIALIVLKYRMPHNNKDVPMSDIAEAFRVTRVNAKQWGIDKKKVGIMGSSAGGHLASTYATHSKKKVAPAFQILFYPVISMDETKTHKGSCQNFLDKQPTREEIDYFSNQNVVNKNTSPAITILSDDDKTVPPTTNGFEYHKALLQAGVPSRMVNFPSGGHGWGFNSSFKYHQAVLDNISAWLDNLKL